MHLVEEPCPGNLHHTLDIESTSIQSSHGGRPTLVDWTSQAQRIRTRQTVHHLRVLSDVHFIASPSTFCTAPAIPRGAPQRGHSNLPLTGRLMQYVLAANFIGLPAMSQPVAHDASGSPLLLPIPPSLVS